MQMQIPKLSTNIPIDELNCVARNTLIDNLGILFTEVGDDFVKATMPVDKRTFRPGGSLHGGANLALAETLAGLGSMLIIDFDKYDVRGIQISASHTRGIAEGIVYATAKAVHVGRQTHLWDIRIEDKEGQLISTGRVTNMIVKRNDK